MITPATYEALVANHFEKLGYHCSVTKISNDYGLDVLAEREDERLAIQAKMYGGSSRQVNRQMIMELHGVKDYFTCDRAILVTDGTVRDDAREVAGKLGIELLHLPASLAETNSFSYSISQSPEHCNTGSNLEAPSDEPDFDQIWLEHIVPLAGETLYGRGNRKNTITSVDWSGVTRITSTGKSSRIEIEIFRLAVNMLLREGTITRDEINQNYVKRASSGVVLILSQVPFFDVEDRPLRLTYRP